MNEVENEVEVYSVASIWQDSVICSLFGIKFILKARRFRLKYAGKENSITLDLLEIHT